MRIKVSYPSGGRLHLSGEWKGLGNVEGECIILILVDKDCPLPEGAMARRGFDRHLPTKPCPIVPRGSAFVGDIRGVYENEDTGQVLYEPRSHMEGMNKWAVDWLKANPHWPNILEL